MGIGFFQHSHVQQVYPPAIPYQRG